MSEHKKRLLTGDTPTGRLHLGHWVGSLENRLALQSRYDSYFLIANLHAFTTQSDAAAIGQSVLDIALDYLSVGIDPEQATLFVETQVPAIYTLSSLCSMLVPFAKVMRNPTIKDEIRDKQLGEHYPFGFPLYLLLQVADILAFQAELVPVGEDQIPHLELARFVARTFNRKFCGVADSVNDADQVSAGGLFPVPDPLVGRIKRLVGLGSPGPHGQLLKMSKSLNNAVFLSDDSDTVRKKIMGMYTDPKRLRATDPGTVENNPLWLLHEAFNPDKSWVAEHQALYREGGIGDVACKRRLIDVLCAFLEPIRARRAVYADDPASVLEILKRGGARANEVAQQVVDQALAAMHQQF